jgi:hypothetical protein
MRGACGGEEQGSGTGTEKHGERLMIDTKRDGSTGRRTLSVLTLY